MSEENLPQTGNASFEALKNAITSCQQVNQDAGDRFAGAGKPITVGKGAIQVAPDYQLSRFACCLIA